MNSGAIEINKRNSYLFSPGWMGRTSGRVYIHRNQRIHFLQLLGIEWESVIQVGPNRKDRIKMNKAEKRKEAKRLKREQKNGVGNGASGEAKGEEGNQEEKEKEDGEEKSNE